MAKETAAAAAADQRKRIVALEAGVSALAVALTANGLAVDPEPVEAAIAAIKSLLTERSNLTAELAAQTDAIKAFEAAADAINVKLTEALTVAGYEIPEGGNSVDASVAIIEDWRSKILGLAEAVVEGGHDLQPNETPFAAAIRLLSVDPGAATPGELAAIARADAAEKRLAEIGAGEAADALPPSPPTAAVPDGTAVDRENGARACGPGIPSCDSDDIKLMIEENAHFELVFSDGESEVMVFSPIALSGSALERRPGGRYLVQTAITLKADARVDLAGAALMLGNEQVAFCPFEPTLAMHAGEQRQFHRTLLFG